MHVTDLQQGGLAKSWGNSYTDGHGNPPLVQTSGIKPATGKLPSIK